MPRDQDSSFEPKIVAKRQRRLTGVDEMVISLSAKWLTHGEIAAHLKVYGAEVSKQTIFPSPARGLRQVVSMPSVSGWALRRSVVGLRLISSVSMPSVSGWALRLTQEPSAPSAYAFCVSMPSVSGWALRLKVMGPLARS
jgi:hypothetical protein